MTLNKLAISLSATASIWLLAASAAGQSSVAPSSLARDANLAQVADRGPNEKEPNEGGASVLPEREFSLANPRATIMSFVYAMEMKDPAMATSTLDFSQQDPTPDLAQEIHYARMLKCCLDRLALIDPTLISDDPTVHEQVFPPGDKEAVIKLARGADDQWRFSPATVSALPALYELLKDKPPVGERAVAKSAAPSAKEPSPEARATAVESTAESTTKPIADEARVSKKRVPDHLKSARRIMRTLIVSLAEKDYPAVVSALDFLKVEEENPEIGPYAKLEIARRLNAVIVRMEDFDYRDISDDPNGPEFRFPMNRAHQPVSIRRGQNGVWQFSADTVADVDALFALYGKRPVLFLTGQRRPWYRRELVMGNEVWQVLLLFGAIFLSLLLGQVVRMIAHWRAATLKEHDRVMRALTYETIAKSVPMIAMLLGLAIGMNNLTLGFNLQLFTGTILHVMLTVIIGYVAFRLVDVVVAFLRELARRSGSTLNDMLVPIVSTSLRLTVIVLVMLEIATAVSHQPPSAVIAGLGAGGLAIGLAAQDTIKNLFGSVMIFADRPFELGDRIVIDGHDGPVETVGFRSSRIRTLDGHLVTVPNGEMAHKTIHNIGKRPFIRRVMNIRIAYGTPPEQIERALDLLRQLLNEHEGFNEEFPPRVFLHDFLDSAVNIRAIYWYHPPNYWDYCAFGERLNLEIMRQFRDADIEFALPAQQLFISEQADEA